MADNSSLDVRTLVIYEVFIRNHTTSGTFLAFEKDLDRIKQLGVDIIWFMPIHPIGKVKKKGRLGCPYSIADYRSINPEYGALDEFQHTINTIHEKGMKVMIDVVYNHTSHDSVLVKQHPEFFHQDLKGRPITTVPEWSDVIDLKHPNPELSQYLIDSLIQWSQLGVDGFRCDVASLVPIEFWMEARRQVALVNPDTIWLAESVHARFLEFRRKSGLSGHSDSEIYQAFDLTYDYDIWSMFQAVVNRSEPIGRYLEMCRFQEAIYPANYTKLHFVENHDQSRIMALAPSREAALAWTAFQVFNRGAFLIYAGQESEEKHTPSLFDRDPVHWKDYSFQEYFTRLFSIKKQELYATGVFTILAASPVIQAVYSGKNASLFGVFNPEGETKKVVVNIPDGEYTNLLTGQTIMVEKHRMSPPVAACVLIVPSHISGEPFHSSLLDTDIPLK